MDGHRRGEQACPPRLSGQHDRPCGEGRLERVAPGRKRMQRRRRAAQQSGPGSGSDGVRDSHQREDRLARCPARTRDERRGARHSARALLRPDLRLRDHAGDRARRRRPDLGGPRPGSARAQRALVGVGGLCLADEHDRSRGGGRAARDVRGDGRDADRVVRRAGRLRRRRVPLRLRLRDRPDRAPRPLRRCRPGRSGAARGGRQARSGQRDRRGPALRRRGPRRQAAGRRLGDRARLRPPRPVRRPRPAAGISRRATSSSDTG